MGWIAKHWNGAEWFSLPAIGLAGFLIGLAVLGTYLASTGPQRTTGKEKKIKLVLATIPSPVFRVAIDGAVKTFKREHPQVEVQILEIGGNYYQKILIMMASRMAPDLMWMGQSFGEFADRGAFLDITDRVARDVDLKKFHPQAIEWYRRNGRQIGIPYTIDLSIIVYNKALFDEAGISYPSEDWDFNEFLTKARALTRDRNGDGRTDQFAYSGGFVAEGWGPPFIDLNGPKATVDTPGRTEYHQIMLRLRDVEHITPSEIEQQQAGSHDQIGLFLCGRYAMIAAYTWDWQRLLSQLADMDWDIALYPRARRRAHWASSGAYMISAETKHPDEAWELNKLLFGEEFMLTAAINGGIPADLEVARKMVAKHRGKPASLYLWVKATDYMYPCPRVPHLQEFQSIVGRWSEEIGAKLISPEEGLRRAQYELTRAIEKARERGAFKAN
ncbi:MAG: sugar ABC transporter substrate-binding protein [Kiritimatiellaeota bacterium]|nr:sugar ABC transporter substrate-binding protein [Kiritimatiellota bacterium]